MTLEDIKDVYMEKDGMGNEVIKLELKKEGIKKFEKATDAHKGEYIAFLCNNDVISEVLVHEKISSAYLLITVPDKELLQHTYETLKSSIK